MGTESELRLAQPLTLKCGLTLPNRLAKAAMAEQLVGNQNLPDERMQAVYKHWSQGGWGLIITGNVFVDATHLGHRSSTSLSASLPPSALLPPYTALALASQGTTTTPTIVQLNHPGRQSPRGAGSRGFFTPPLAPSAIPLSLGPGLIPSLLQHLVFPTPRAMTADEITTVISQFARAARVVADAGFHGVEIHAAHGYLLSQFLAKGSNTREDGYGGDARGRARMVVEVVRAVREATKDVQGGRFCVGVKLNSADYQGERGEAEVREWVEQVRAVVGAGVDFVEVSGGSYEDPKMVGSENPAGEEKKSERSKAREAFFLEFARIIRKEFPDVPLMVTGGFSSRAGMEKALVDGDCDLIGLGRPAVIDPLAPSRVLLNREVSDQDAVLYRKKNEAPWIMQQLGLKAVGAGMDTMWYMAQIQQMAKS